MPRVGDGARRRCRRPEAVTGGRAGLPARDRDRARAALRRHLRSAAEQRPRRGPGARAADRHGVANDPGPPGARGGREQLRPCRAELCDRRVRVRLALNRPSQVPAHLGGGRPGRAPRVSGTRRWRGSSRVASATGGRPPGGRRRARAVCRGGRSCGAHELRALRRRDGDTDAVARRRAARGPVFSSRPP